MAKVYDYRGIVSAMVAASEEWRQQNRVTRKTYLRLRVLLSQVVINRMTGQLLDYQNPMSTQKAVECLLDLPAWKTAYRWARAKCPPGPPSLGMAKPEPEPCADIGFTSTEVVTLQDPLVVKGRA